MVGRDALWRALGYLGFVLIAFVSIVLYFNDQEHARRERCIQSREDVRTAIVATVVYAFNQSETPDVARTQTFVKGLQELLEDTLPDSGCE